MSPESDIESLLLDHLINLLLLLFFPLRPLPEVAGAVAGAAAVFLVAAESVCWTAKQPPNGPATAALRHRTVQTFLVEAAKC